MKWQQEQQSPTVSIQCILGFKNWGLFRPSGVSISCNFQILEVISFIMYIVVTSDVNKDATFWGVLWQSQWSVVELRYAYEVFWLEIQVKNILISVFWIDRENGPFRCFKSRTNLDTDRILRWLWSHSLTFA